MTWTLASLIHRRHRIPLINNDYRSYSPSDRPRRFSFRAFTLGQPRSISLPSSTSVTGKRKWDESEDTCDSMSCTQEDGNTVDQGETVPVPTARGKRMKYVASTGERHSGNSYRREEEQCEPSMHASQTTFNNTPVPANAGAISDSASEVTQRQPADSSTSDGEEQGITLASFNAKVTEAKEDDGTAFGGEVAPSEEDSNGGDEVEKTENADSGSKVTQNCSSDDELKLLYLDPEDWEAEIAEEAQRKAAVDSMSSNASTNESENKRSEAGKDDNADENGDKNEPFQNTQTSSSQSLPISNDTLHKYQSAKVMINLWTQLQGISTSEDDLIRLFAALYTGENSGFGSRLPPPPVFPLKSCLRNSSLLQRLNASIAVPAPTESAERTWRSDDGEYEVSDVPKNLHGLVQEHLDTLLQRYKPNKGWSREFIIAKLRGAILSAKAGLPSALKETGPELEKRKGIEEIVNRKCGDVTEAIMDNTRERKVRFSEGVDCLNIDDGSRTRLDHPEEGAWHKFPRGAKPTKDPESESARAQIEGLAPVEEDFEDTENIKAPTDTPDDESEPSGEEEQDQDLSAAESVRPPPPTSNEPFPRQERSRWKATIQHLEDAAREISARRSPPLRLVLEGPVQNYTLFALPSAQNSDQTPVLREASPASEVFSDLYSPSRFQYNIEDSPREIEHTLPNQDAEEGNSHCTPSTPQLACQGQNSATTTPPLPSPQNANDENTAPTRENRPPPRQDRTPALVIRTPPVNENRYFRVIWETNPGFSPPSPEFAHHADYDDWFEMQDEELKYELRRRRRMARHDELRFIRPENVDYENHDSGFTVFSGSQDANSTHYDQNNEGGTAESEFRRDDGNGDDGEEQEAYNDDSGFRVWRDNQTEEARDKTPDKEDNGPGCSVWRDNWNERDQESERTEGEGEDLGLTAQEHSWDDPDDARNVVNAGQVHEGGDPGFTVRNDSENSHENRDDLEDDENWYDNDSDGFGGPLIGVWDNDLDDDDEEEEHRQAQVTERLTREAEDSDGGYGDENEGPGFTVWSDGGSHNESETPSREYSGAENEDTFQHSLPQSPGRIISTYDFREHNEPSESSRFRPRVFHRPSSPEYSSPGHHPKEYSPETVYDGQWTPERLPCRVEPGANFEDDEPVASPRTPINRPRVFHRPTSPILEGRLSCPDSPWNNNTASHPPSTERELTRFSISPVYKRNSSYVSPIYTCAPTPPPPASPVPWYRRYLQDLTPPVCERISNSTYVSPIYTCRPTPPPASPVYNEPRSGRTSPCPFVSPESWPRQLE